MSLPLINQISRYETKQHGSIDFPYIVYHTLIPKFIYSFPLHWHDEMEIIYIHKGSCFMTLNKTTYHVSEGDIVLILPGVLHAMEQEKDFEAEYYNIVFDIRMLSCDSSDPCFSKYLKAYLDGQITLPDIVTKDFPAHEPMTALLMELADFRNEHGHGIELMIKSNLFKIFWHLEPLQTQHEPQTINNAYLSQIQKMKDLLAFLGNNYASPISLKEAADFCGYSTSYFMKFFKSFTGVTFVDYLNNFRMKKAEEFLLNTDYSVLQISEMTGFENHSYFIRLFKKIYGATPLQYRKMHIMS